MNIESGISKADGCLIGNNWTEASSGETIDVVSPSDGEVFTSIASGSEEDVDRAVAAARKAFDGGDWSKLTATERGRLMMRLGEKILEHADRLGEIEAKDTGKPMRQARGDIDAAARYFEYYGAAADKVHGDTIPFLAGYTVQTYHEPHGVTGHIIPWNYPAQMYGRTLAPALAMGNATVLKPAEEACLTSIEMTKLALEVGFPEGAINLVTGYGQKAGAALSKHKGIDFISFTGSPEVGSLIQQEAAKNFIGCCMELGGKSPQIIFEDADLDAALPVVVNAIIQNSGQTCSAGSRALVQKSILDKVLDALAESFGKLEAAPAEADGDLGPVISATQRDRVEGFLQKAGDGGAPIVARGGVASGAPEGGFYVAPAVLGPMSNDHELAQEEIFGPVLSVIPFEDEAEAIRLANDTEYGLIAGVWTRDANRLPRVGRAMRCGQVYLNGYGAAGGIELPFGGIGKSGHGREKGFVALHEFSQIKTIIHNHG